MIIIKKYPKIFTYVSFKRLNTHPSSLLCVHRHLAERPFLYYEECLIEVGLSRLTPPSYESETFERGLVRVSTLHPLLLLLLLK